MEDSASLILLFLLYLFSSLFSGKRKKKKTTERDVGRSRTRQRRAEQPKGMEDFERLLRESKKWMNGQHAADQEMPEKDQEFDLSTDRNAMQPMDKDSCHGTSGIHLHEVTSMQMNEANEGEDPCHVGEAALAQDEPYTNTEEEEVRRALAQDVLRGVIMSEILTRPCVRRGMGNRR